MSAGCFSRVGSAERRSRSWRVPRLLGNEIFEAVTGVAPTGMKNLGAMSPLLRLLIVEVAMVEHLQSAIHVTSKMIFDTTPQSAT